MDTTGPWIAPAAVLALDRLITREFSIFEFGSGSSTLWFSKRAGKVISVENNPEWFRSVQAALSAAGVSNCELKLVPIDDFLVEMDRQPEGSLDLVVVDNEQNEHVTRNDCVAASIPKVKPGGYLLLDDSDREQFLSLEDLLSGWGREIYSGFKARPLAATETTIYRKPSAIS
jgi:predicted O-methyltransferase YrrM